MPVSRKRKKPKKKQSKKTGIKPYQVVKQKFVEAPMPDLNGVPFEGRVQIILEMAKKAEKEYEDSYLQLQDYLNEYDPLYLLSFSVLYFLSGPEGIDQEAIDGYIDFPPFYVEVLQALALMQPSAISVRPLSEQAEKFKETLTQYNKSQTYRYFNLAENAKSPKDLHPVMLRVDMMVHTLAVRNWAYENQMQDIAYDLADSIRNKFQQGFEYDPFLLLDTLFGLAELNNEKLNGQIGKMRKVFKAKTFDEAFDAHESNYPDIEKGDRNKRIRLWESCGKKLQNLKHVLLSHGDIRLKDCFTFSLDEIKSLWKEDYPVTDDLLIKVLDGLSYQFGDLKDINRDFIFLSNPVHSKPFIKLEDGRYFSAITFMFSHLGVDLLETVIRENKDLFLYYNKQKGDYLENQIRTLFEQAFPDATILDGSLWKNPEDGKTYENDLIVLIQDFAIIVEAKSGTITPPARRGAPNRLFETLKELVVAPSEQAIRFENYLKDNPRVHNFKTKVGKTNTIDSSKIKYYVPLGVTLSFLGSIGCNLKKLIDAKVINHNIDQLAPSISLSDLQVIFEVLTLDAQKVHYLSRRREFEAHVAFQGDELDLFGFYLDTGFNIGETEYDSEYFLNLTLKSKELDPYFVGKFRGVSVKKPEMAMTKYWFDLLEYLRKRSKLWLQVSYMLLNASKQDQTDFEKAIRKLKYMVKYNKAKEKHNWVAFYCGPPRRRYAIIAYAYQGISKSERNEILNEIVERERNKSHRGVTIFGFNLDTDTYPFSVVAGSVETDFFDKLAIYDTDNGTTD